MTIFRPNLPYDLKKGTLFSYLLAHVGLFVCRSVDGVVKEKEKDKDKKKDKKKGFF